MTQAAEWIRLRLQLGRVFTPNSPVSDKDSFQGRREEIQKVIGAVLAAGAHAVIFGERGVGKTSLAGLIQAFWTDFVKGGDILVARVNCEPQDDYIAIWAHVADDLLKHGMLEERVKNPEFAELLAGMANGETDAFFVRRCFQASACTAVVIIDEFDRVQDEETTERFADTIKGLSDYGVDTTLIIVGVADTLDELIANHASVDRNLRQVLLPRLNTAETSRLVESRYEQIGLGYEPGAIRLIARLAQGLPYYAHLIGQASGFAAVDNRREKVSVDDVQDGLMFATEATQESVKRSYHDAVTSTRKNSIHAHVLLACALAERDEFGYFTAVSIQERLSRVTGQPVEMTRYLNYLTEFSTERRGGVLRKEGQRWRQRYRFANPLMETYVILRGIENGSITPGSLG